MKTTFLYKTDKILQRFILLTPLLHSNDRGFTIWNLCNIILSSQYPENKQLQIFNANNSSAVFFGSMSCYLINNKNFHIWLKKEKISHLTEKIVHIAPFLYYLRKGYYNETRYSITILSIMYELMWSYFTGKNIIDKSDIYIKMNKYYKWYICWCMIIYGHFFKINTNRLLH